MTKRTPYTPNGQALSDKLALGLVELQCCRVCAALQYPPTEFCRQCLSDELSFTACEANGTVVASAAVHRSFREEFASGGPWPVVSVKLSAGPVVFAHAATRLKSGTRVKLAGFADRLGDGVFAALSTASDLLTIRQRFTDE